MDRGRLRYTTNSTSLRRDVLLSYPGLVDQPYKERAEDGSEDTGHGDGKAAHGALHFAHLEGLAGAHGMG